MKFARTFKRRFSFLAFLHQRSKFSAKNLSLRQWRVSNRDSNLLESNSAEAQWSAKIVLITETKGQLCERIAVLDSFDCDPIEHID